MEYQDFIDNIDIATTCDLPINITDRERDALSKAFQLHQDKIGLIKKLGLVLDCDPDESIIFEKIKQIKTASEEYEYSRIGVVERPGDRL